MNNVAMPDFGGTDSMVSQSTSPTPTSTAPQTLYKGPTINSLTGTAKTLGIQHNYDPSTGVFTAAGQKIPVSSIKNGEPYGNVMHLAQAGGHDVAKQSDGTVHITPAQNSGLNTPGNPAGVPLQIGGVNRPFHPVDPLGNVPLQHQTSGLNYLQQRHQTIYNNNGLPAGGLPMDAQTQPTQTQGAGVTAGADMSGSQAPDTSGFAQYLMSLLGNAPQAPELPQMPTFTPDYSMWQQITPFSWDANQAMQDAYNLYAPQYQQQMADMDAKVNEQMNNRGLFNSGIAQAAVNDANAKIYGQLQNAITKYVTQNRAEAYKEWLGQANLLNKQNQQMLTNQLNAYRANIDTLYKQGQLTNQQYAQAVNKWHDMVTAAQDVYNQQEQDARQANQQQFDWAKLLQQEDFTAQQNQNKLDNQSLQSIGLAYGPDGQLHPTLAAQQFNEKTLEAMGLVQGPDGKLHPTLQSQQLTAKILESMGYAQDPTTGKLVPTLAATQDARNYALNLAKVTGYVVNPDGSLTPTLDNVIKTGQLKVAQENADTRRAQVAAEINHLANQDSLASQRLSLTEKQFEERKAQDDRSYQIALTNATTSQLKNMITILDGKRNQAASNIRSSLAAGQQPRAQDVKDYDDANKALVQILNAINDGSAYASAKGKSSK